MLAWRSLAVVPLALSLIVATATAGCRAAETEETEEDEGQLRPIERKAMGLASEYPADRSLRGRLTELEGSQKARREAAWKAVGRVLAPVPLAAGIAKKDGTAATVPRFRTWYGRDDFMRLFGKLYDELPPADRKARKPFSTEQIQKAFEANATSLGESSDEEYFARLAEITDDDKKLQGAGSNHRVGYSPGLFRHMLGNYGNLFECLPKMASIPADQEPASKTNFAPCFKEEFPEDAVITKMSWSRALWGEERLAMPTFKTDAKTVADKLAGKPAADEGGWGNPTGEVDPPESSIYSVTTERGMQFRLNAIHIVTKELREWLWITLWWSDSPDTDFGQDRPEEIKALPGPWAHYKMNVSVAYKEMDADPRGGFGGSLGDALAAAYGGVGKPSWASNPYLEDGPHNAQSNCIGCHQHAGTNESTESILASPEKFPESSRTQLRKNFPVDYLWAVSSAPEGLAEIIKDRVEHYDLMDR